MLPSVECWDALAPCDPRSGVTVWVTPGGLRLSLHTTVRPTYLAALTSCRYSFRLGLAGRLLVASPARPDPAEKVDPPTRDPLKAGAATQPVIISVTPGCRTGIREAIERRGDVVRAEHDIIDAI